MDASRAVLLTGASSGTACPPALARQRRFACTARAGRCTRPAAISRRCATSPTRHSDDVPRRHRRAVHACGRQADHRGARQCRRTDQQRRVQSQRDDRRDTDGRGAAAVRDQRVRPVQADAAGPAGDAGAGERPDRDDVVDLRPVRHPRRGYYQATKFALEAISDSLRNEVAKFGIKVVVVQPSPIRGGFVPSTLADLDMAGGQEEACTPTSGGTLWTGMGPTGRSNTRPAGTDRGARRDGGRGHRAGGHRAQAEDPLPGGHSGAAAARQRALFGERAWDRFVRFFFPIP